MDIKFSYLDCEGYAEPIRLALKLVEVDFIDERIKKEDCSELSQSMMDNDLPT